MEVLITDSSSKSDSEPDVKELSLFDRSDLVADQFEKDFGFSPFFVSAVLDNDLIIRDMDNRGFLKASYTVSSEEAVSIADQATWVEVRLQKQWLEKSLYIRSANLDIGEFIINESDNNEMVSSGRPIKELSEDRLGFYGYLWGSSTQKDLHKEYFTKETDGLTELFDQLGGVPFTYAHAANKATKATVFGMVDTMTEDDIGMWVEVQITNHKKYRQMLKPIIDEEALYPSSETLVGAKQVKKDGHITRWVTSFMTGTTHPAEWRMMDHPIDEVKSFYKSIGVEEGDLEDAMGIDASADKEASKASDNAETQKEEVANQGAAEARIKALINIEFQKLQLLQLKL
jgi:hypothetical protein